MRERINPWLLVALLWVVALLNYLDRQVVFSLFPMLRVDLHASDFELGLISTVFLWVYAFLSPFTGYLADRFGRARVIVISLLVWSSVTLLTAQARSIEEMICARALMGLSEACYLPAALALIVESHRPNRRSLATGLHQTGLCAGMVFGGVLGGWMGEHYGWRPLFLMLGAVGIGYFFVLYPLLRQVRTSHGEPGRPNFLTSLRTLARIPGYPSLVAAFTATSISNWLIYTWLPLFLYEKFGLSLTEAGFSASFYLQAATYGGILVGGWAADRWSRHTNRGRLLTQVAGLACSAPFLIVVGVTPSYVVLIAALLAVGIGRGLYDCNTMPVLSQVAAPEIRATGFGVFNLFGCLAGGLTAMSAGYLKSAFGLSAAFQMAGSILLLASVLLWRVRLGTAVEERREAY
jgi:MFS family permease